MEALCRDLGRNHDEYTKKLEKLRRNQPAPTQQAGMTRANGATAAIAPSAPPQRTERPKQQERSERPSAQSERNNAASRAMEEMAETPMNNVRSPMAAPRAGERSARPGQNSRAKVDEEDDFGDTDVNSLLM